jgi:hypothetical protein
MSRCPPHWEKVLQTRGVRFVVDATEIQCQGTSGLAKSRMLFSSYKNNYTYKFLVAVTSSGAICFVSFAYPGKISDFKITEVCGILDLLRSGDLVLADRGFNIQSLLAKHYAGVLVGHTHRRGEKAKTGGQYNREQLMTSRRFSNLRIHVESAMRSIKRMAFLCKKIDHRHRHLIHMIMSISAMMANYGKPLLNKEDRDAFYEAPEAV